MQRRTPTSATDPRTTKLSAVIGVRDVEVTLAVQSAAALAGFDVRGVVGSAGGIINATDVHRPDLVLASLDVLGIEPEATVRRLAVSSPDVVIVVLSPLGTLPVWLLEAGADAVLDQREIGELKQVLRDLGDLRDR